MRIEEKDGRLNIVDFDELGACKIACKIERDGIHFYRDLAARVKVPEDREVLEFLAKKEREHLEFFEGELFRLREEKENSFEEDDLLSEIDYGIFQPYQGIKDLDRALNTRKKALRLGLAVEKRVIQFYEHCLEHVTSDDAKKEISLIIREEYEHKRLLEEMLAGAEGTTAKG